MSDPVQRGPTGVIDPTANVLALVEAVVKRINDLHDAELRRVDELMELRAAFYAKLAEAEAKRIDAIRAVDVGAVAIATERATQQAAVLAAQVSQSADTLRALVATTAATVAAQLQQMSAQLVERLALLERSQYENKGKSGVTSPLLMLIAAIAGGIIVFLIEQQLKGK